MNSVKPGAILLASIIVLTACGDKQAPSSSSVAASGASPASTANAAPPANERVANESATSESTMNESTMSESTAIPVITSPGVTDAWIGKWDGPEGTSLEISGGNGKYVLTIADLDSVKQYTGISTGSQITFERNGTTEIIQASTGADTGMKWLAEKSNCLRVRVGEGWCKNQN